MAWSENRSRSQSLREAPARIQLAISGFAGTVALYSLDLAQPTLALFRHPNYCRFMTLGRRHRAQNARRGQAWTAAPPMRMFSDMRAVPDFSRCSVAAPSPLASVSFLHRSRAR
jgi:hypothetical protein